jgi:hypothetical protein
MRTENITDFLDVAPTISKNKGAPYVVDIAQRQWEGGLYGCFCVTTGFG